MSLRHLICTSYNESQAHFVYLHVLKRNLRVWRFTQIAAQIAWCTSLWGPHICKETSRIWKESYILWRKSNTSYMRYLCIFKYTITISKYTCIYAHIAASKTWSTSSRDPYIWHKTYMYEDLHTHCSSIHNVVHISLRHVYSTRILRPIYLTQDLHVWRFRHIAASITWCTSLPETCM